MSSTSVARFRAMTPEQLNTWCERKLDGPMDEDTLYRVIEDLEKECNRGADLDRLIDWEVVDAECA